MIQFLLSHFLRLFVPKYILKQFNTQRLNIVQNVLIPSSPKMPQGVKYANNLILYTTHLKPHN